MSKAENTRQRGGRRSEVLKVHAKRASIDLLVVGVELRQIVPEIPKRLQSQFDIQSQALNAYAYFFEALASLLFISSSATKPSTSCSAIQDRTLSMTLSSPSPPSMTSYKLRRSNILL